jgi:hypothetical protein
LTVWWNVPAAKFQKVLGVALPIVPKEFGTQYVTGREGARMPIDRNFRSNWKVGFWRNRTNQAD